MSALLHVNYNRCVTLNTAFPKGEGVPRFNTRSTAGGWLPAVVWSVCGTIQALLTKPLTRPFVANELSR